MTERNARSGAALAAAFLAVMLLGGCNPGNSGAPAAMTPLASTAPAAGAPETAAPAAGIAPTSGPAAPDKTPCPTTGNAKRFAKIRFALHAGLALGAFHRYIYKPLRSGGFMAG
ncbi:hypothetical protein AB0P04_43915, partial [Streptomyces anulatus]